MREEGRRGERWEGKGGRGWEIGCGFYLCMFSNFDDTNLFVGVYWMSS